MFIYSITFYFFSFVAVLSALMVISSKNPDALTKLKIKKSTECTGFLELITIKAERTATKEKK